MYSVAHYGEQFLSTPSARRATGSGRVALRSKRISIHALREEGDLWGMGHVVIAAAISIHALREEGDPKPSRGGIRL